MKTMVWSAEQVMRGLKIPDSERIKYMFQDKLVDCLEKCLICRHIRRFAD